MSNRVYIYKGRVDNLFNKLTLAGSGNLRRACQKLCLFVKKKSYFLYAQHL